MSGWDAATAIERIGAVVVASRIAPAPQFGIGNSPPFILYGKELMRLRVGLRNAGRSTAYDVSVRA